MSKTKFEILVDTIELVKNRQLEASPLLLTMDIDKLLAICNGCGAAGAKIDLIPDGMYGLDISPACYAHDLDYALGETEADRRFADERLKRNLLTLIASGNPVMWLARRIRVNTYYKAVRLCGEQAFWAGKAHNIITLGTY